MSGYPEYNEDPRQDEPMRRLGSWELASMLRVYAYCHGRVVVGVNHTDGGSSMYGFVLAQRVDLWTVPDKGEGVEYVEPSETSPGRWMPGIPKWAGEQVVLVSGAVGACPDSRPGDEEAALADPSVLDAVQLADQLDALPDLPVVLGMHGDPDLSPLDSIDWVDWACHPDDCTEPSFDSARARRAQVQPPCPDDVSLEEWDTREPVLVQWPATVDLWNSETCWVRPD